MATLERAVLHPVLSPNIAFLSSYGIIVDLISFPRTGGVFDWPNRRDIYALRCSVSLPGADRIVYA